MLNYFVPRPLNTGTSKDDKFRASKTSSDCALHVGLGVHIRSGGSVVGHGKWGDWRGAGMPSFLPEGRQEDKILF